MSLLLHHRIRAGDRIKCLYIPLCLYYYTSAGVNTSRLSPFFTFHYVSITTAECLRRKLKLITFTFHYVSITTRTSQSPTLQSQFYHFLSTLSFSLLIEYKYQQYRKKISYFYSKIAYLSTSHVFCFITGRQL